MGNSGPHSEVKTGPFGGTYVEHYGENGRYVGKSEERTGFFGGSYTVHYDNQGKYTGKSEQKVGPFGGSYATHYDRCGDYVGKSETYTSWGQDCHRQLDSSGRVLSTSHDYKPDYVKHERIESIPHACATKTGVTRAYHGTSSDAASSIQSQGFKASSDGMLGEGVYVTRDHSKAADFARFKGEGHGEVLKVNAKLGRTKECNGADSSWHDSYNSAYLPAGNGVKREEHCVEEHRVRLA